ncbi:MAG: hypothetical protein AAB483_01730 [Patescibacteria group bacterium]|mgnify:CR=1 FL=1
MKKLLLASLVAMGMVLGLSQAAQAIPGALPGTYNLREGDVVGASAYGDPDLFIINKDGYKRLFLNPIIFNFYGHLGGYSKVKPISITARDQFETSLLFRNCETNAQAIYALEVTGEDTGKLHWLNMTGDAAVAQDSQFFRKIFCINNNEYSWYSMGPAYTSLSQIPAYSRTSGEPISSNAPCKGYEVLRPVTTTNSTKVTFSFNTSNCSKGVAVEVSSTANFSSRTEVGRVYATGEYTFTAHVPSPAGQQVYYRIVDLATMNVIITGQPFTLSSSVVPTPTPGTIAPDDERLYEVSYIVFGVEEYHADYGMYPTDITWATIGKYMSNDLELVDPAGGAYGYAVNADRTKYHVWAKLSAYSNWLTEDSDFNSAAVNWGPRPVDGTKEVCNSSYNSCIFDIDSSLLESARSKARDAKRISDVSQIRTAIELYYDDHGQYPSDITDSKVVIYFASGTTPKDPTTNAIYGYAHNSTLTKYQVWTTLEVNNTSALSFDADVPAYSNGWGPRAINGDDSMCSTNTTTCIFDLGIL